VDVVESEADDGAAALGFLSNELIAKLVILQQLVAQGRDAGSTVSSEVFTRNTDGINIPHDGGQTCPQLQSLEVRDVLLEVLVDLLFVLLESRELGDVVLGHYTIHLGLAELDNALAQVAQIFEEVVVVGIDELPIDGRSVDVKQEK
jgi:hypothetical protein